MERTVDITEHADDLEEEIAEIEKAQDQLVEKLEEDFESFEEVPPRYEDAYNEMEENRVEKEGQVKRFREIAEEYGGSEWVITDVTLGQLAKIQDDVREASFEFDTERGEIAGGVPKQGYGSVLILEEAIEKQPPDAPTQEAEIGSAEQPDPAEYPSVLGEWLFDKVNALNTVGDTDLGNSSLQDRMNG